MSNQTGWILIGPTTYQPSGYEVPFKRIDIRTGRWSANSTIDNTRAALNRVWTSTPADRGNIELVDYMAETLLGYYDYENTKFDRFGDRLGLTNTDALVLIVDFLKNKVVFWQEYTNTIVAEVDFDSFIMNPDSTRQIQAEYFLD